MEFVTILLWVAGALLLGGFVAMFAYTYPIAKRVYREQLVRTDPEKWGRCCSAPENEEQQQMWDAGVAWMEQHRQRITQVQIENDGLRLYGEYFDFGADRCVMILPGRCESLMYSYYFAPPYEQAGFNILVVDTRCHGKSDGIYNTVGVKESRDVLKWAEYACETFGNREVWFHGICIGTAAGLFAMTAKDSPDYLKGLVTEGCFVSFRETFKRHMMEQKRPLFPVLDLCMLLINRYAGIQVYTQTPLAAMKKLKKSHQALFLYGTKDVFSIPEKTKQLFAACTAGRKELVWFDRGGHSHLRINNREAYDRAIIDFFEREAPKK